MSSFNLDAKTPAEIFRSANADARRGEFGDALRKYVWLVHNGEEGEDFSELAIYPWGLLAEAYQDARTALIAHRNAATEAVLARSDFEKSFRLVARMNAALGEVNATRDLFVAVLEMSFAESEKIYTYAQASLVANGDFMLCGQYVLDGVAAMQSILGAFRRDLESWQEVSERSKVYSENAFIHASCTLVALLALNKRSEAASEIAQRIRQEFPVAVVRSLIDHALLGEFPLRLSRRRKPFLDSKKKND